MKLFLQLCIISITLLISSCSSSKKTTAAAPVNSSPAAAANATNDGSSFEKAIVVKNISEEYAYIRKVCPGCKVIKQALRSNNKKYYDVLYVNNNGTEVVYYFDINSFYGKLF
jgi:hypothetical protein